jgi:hypothetical protein
MAGTTTTSRRTQRSGSDVNDLLIQFNKLVDNAETLRQASFGVFNYKVEDLGAGADLTARAFFVAPFALTVLDSVQVIPEAASAGVDGSNTLVLTLRNITASEDIATITRTTDLAANTPVALTLTAANADIAASDVLGLVVTQGAAANAGTFLFQFAYQRQTVDAAADMTAAKVGDLTATAITE